jgi:hypothetical protein
LVLGRTFPISGTQALQSHETMLNVCTDFSNIWARLKYWSDGVRLYLGKKPECPIRPYCLFTFALGR